MTDDEASDILAKEFAEADNRKNIYARIDKYRNGEIEAELDGEFSVNELKRIIELMEQIS